MKSAEKNKKMISATLAEKELCKQLLKNLKEIKSNGITTPKILNIGAGRTIVIEEFIAGNVNDFICDRIDVDSAKVSHPNIGKCWEGSIESMSPVESDNYYVAFSNYVLEHVPDIRKASMEIFRILKPSGRFIATIPNVNAPEFVMAKLTPLWLHKIVRRGEAWETHYAFSSINDLVAIFEASGFNTLDVKYYPHIELYLERVSPILGILGRIYDKTISSLKINRLMGSTCVVFEKPL